MSRLAESRGQPLPAGSATDPGERSRQWRLVRSRWNQSYRETPARRNRAGSITVNRLTGRGQDVERRGERVFGVSRRFLERMGSLTPAVFGSAYSLLDRHPENFRRTSTPGKLRTLVYAGLTTPEGSNRRRVIWAGAPTQTPDGGRRSP